MDFALYQRDHWDLDAGTGECQNLGGPHSSRSRDGLHDCEMGRGHRVQAPPKPKTGAQAPAVKSFKAQQERDCPGLTWRGLVMHASAVIRVDG